MLARAAWAHAGLVRSDPPAGGRVEADLTRVRLVFSEPLEATLSRITLVGENGSTTRLEVAGDPRDVNSIVAPVAGLAQGVYRLRWHIVSADGHPVDGSFVFGVGVTPPATSDALATGEESQHWGPAVAGAPVLAGTLRGAAVGVMMALAGMLLFLAWATRGAEIIPPVARRLTTWLAVAGPTLLALHLIVWLGSMTAGESIIGEAGSAVLLSGVGQLELWRTGLALLAAWAYLLARRPGLALAFAAGALVVSGAVGHSSALNPTLSTPAKALHLLALAPWVGGLLWLLSCARGDTAMLARQAARVSAVALACVLVVSVSGAAQTLLFLPSPLDLFRSSYGAVTLAKVAGLLALVCYGAHHKFRVLPRLQSDAATPGRFAGTLRQELALMAIVLVVGGLLAYVPPPSASTATTTAQASHAHPTSPAANATPDHE